MIHVKIPIFLFKNHSIATCLGTAINSCDGFLEEDCTYDMLNDYSTIPSRPVAEPQHCQEECQNLFPICRHWVYQNKTCYLMKSGRRNCSVISGPKYPKIATCPCKKFLVPFWPCICRREFNSAICNISYNKSLFVRFLLL